MRQERGNGELQVQGYFKVTQIHKSHSAYLRDARHHEVGEHLDVVVVFEAVLDVAEELEDVEAVDARVEEGVHALERRLPQVEAVVHLVLERTHLHLADQLLAFLKIDSRKVTIWPFLISL